MLGWQQLIEDKEISYEYSIDVKHQNIEGTILGQLVNADGGKALSKMQRYSTSPRILVSHIRKKMVPFSEKKKNYRACKFMREN